MPLIRFLLTIIIVIMPLRAFAEANCSIFESIERIQFAQSRLSSMIDPRAPSQDATLLINEVKRLDADQIETAASGALSATDIAFLENYVASANVLSSNLARSDYRAVSAYFVDPSFKIRQDRAKQVLPRLECNLTSSNAATGGTQMSQNSGTRTKTGKNFTIANVGIALALTITSVLIAVYAYKAFSARQNQKRRQSRRFPTHLETSIRTNGKSRAGILLDLSCNGAKVKIPSEEEDKIGDKIQVWIGSGWFQADIRWQNPHYTGLNFNSPLPISYVAGCVSQSSETAKVQQEQPAA